MGQKRDPVNHKTTQEIKINQIKTENELYIRFQNGGETMKAYVQWSSGNESLIELNREWKVRK